MSPTTHTNTTSHKYYIAFYVGWAEQTYIVVLLPSCMMVALRPMRPNVTPADIEAYINEMMRVLKPGGKFVIATWCQRDDREIPFDKKDKRDLRFLYEEWYVDDMDETEHLE